MSIVDLSFDFLVSLVLHLCASSSVGAMGAKAPSKDKDYTTWIARPDKISGSPEILFGPLRHNSEVIASELPVLVVFFTLFVQNLASSEANLFESPRSFVSNDRTKF